MSRDIPRHVGSAALTLLTIALFTFPVFVPVWLTIDVLLAALGALLLGFPIAMIYSHWWTVLGDEKR